MTFNVVDFIFMTL